MGLPNLFILGAAKSGTTSLWRLLGCHPDIDAPTPKEPTFFCSYFQDIKDPISYYNLFDNSKKFRIDASHAYLTNPETSSVLAETFPSAKFIVILRDPAKRSYALYRHMRRFRHADGEPFEPIDDFLLALKAEEERFASRDFLANCRQYFWNFMYARSSMFDEQLSRYFQHYGWQRFFITTLAELEKDPRGLMARIADFLLIDQEPLLSQEEWHFNADQKADPLPLNASDFLDHRLGGVTERVDRLLGRTLDWSL